MGASVFGNPFSSHPLPSSRTLLFYLYFQSPSFSAESSLFLSFSPLLFACCSTSLFFQSKYSKFLVFVSDVQHSDSDFCKLYFL